MKASWFTALALASMALAMPQDVPPLPPLRGDVASLKDTMKFIQDKLPGKVKYIAYGHDNVTGANDGIKRSFELSNASADTSRCYIGFHCRFDNWRDITDKDDSIDLRLVREIVLMQMDTVLQQATAKDGHPEWSARADPPVSLVVVTSGDPSNSIEFNFYDETLYARVQGPTTRRGVMRRQEPGALLTPSKGETRS